MNRHPEFPELLDQYMEDFGRSEQWITVQEIRTYFQPADADGTGDFRVSKKRFTMGHSPRAGTRSHVLKNFRTRFLPTGSSRNILSRNVRSKETIRLPMPKIVAGNPG
jgi:hypothetical protein